MNIGILEYDNTIAYHLRDIIHERYSNCQVTIWNSVSALKEDIIKGGVFKILFVSLIEESKTGNPREVIDYFARLQELRGDMKLIYICDPSPVVFEVFRSDPIYILSGDFKEEEVHNALSRAFKELSLSKEKNFTVINKQGIFTIPYTRIYYVESDKRKLNIYGHDGLIKSINLKISDFLRYEHGVYFLQCHKSYAVNLMHISQLEKYEIILENGMKLPISQSRYMETRAGYLDYLENE